MEFGKVEEGSVDMSAYFIFIFIFNCLDGIGRREKLRRDRRRSRKYVVCYVVLSIYSAAAAQHKTQE